MKRENAVTTQSSERPTSQQLMVRIGAEKAILAERTARRHALEVSHRAIVLTGNDVARQKSITALAEATNLENESIRAIAIFEDEKASAEKREAAEAFELAIVTSEERAAAWLKDSEVLTAATKAFAAAYVACRASGAAFREALPQQHTFAVEIETLLWTPGVFYRAADFELCMQSDGAFGSGIANDSVRFEYKRAGKPMLLDRVRENISRALERQVRPSTDDDEPRAA